MTTRPSLSMPDRGARLRIDAGAQGLAALIGRALKVDSQATVRIRQLPDAIIEVFVTTPFEVVASRRAQGTVSIDGATAAAGTLYSALVDALGTTSETPAPDPAAAIELSLGPHRDMSWPGALPPASGFYQVEEVPATVVRTLADKGRDLVRQFSGPAGPPASLLKQTVLSITPAQDSSDGSAPELADGSAPESADGSAPELAETTEVPMRMIFACTSLGLIPGFAAPITVPRHVRIARRGRWIRLDAPFGSIYHSTRLSLF